MVSFQFIADRFNFAECQFRRGLDYSQVTCSNAEVKRSNTFSARPRRRRTETLC
jgi:hypothetical protein